MYPAITGIIMGFVVFSISIIHHPTKRAFHPHYVGRDELPDGGFAPRFQAVFLTQAGSVRVALSHPSRQQVPRQSAPGRTQTVSRKSGKRDIKGWKRFLYVE